MLPSVVGTAEASSLLACKRNREWLSDGRDTSPYIHSCQLKILKALGEVGAEAFAVYGMVLARKLRSWA